MRIAIVGSGISGLVCAHLLHPHHAITLFEANGYLGGHTNTVRVDVDDETHQVDTGFIVHNERTYPNFVKLLDQLGVATQPSDMSFSLTDPSSGLAYRSTNLNTIFAQRRNLVRPAFWRMLSDVVRFNRAAKALLADTTDAAGREATGGSPEARFVVSESLDEFLARGHYSQLFIDQFLIPLGASIWSADPETFTRFPAAAYARFMDNHGLLDVRGTPEWRTVTGGSRRYVDAITAPFADRIRLHSPIQKVVRRESGGVELISATRGPETFDRIILATHSDQSLRLLADPSTIEREILGAIGYQPNVATLHTDESFLPRNPRARASWNYHLAEGGRAATLTYWMNHLQSIESRHQLLITLNRHDDVDPEQVLGRFDYSHPVFDGAAMRAQQRRAEIQGVNDTFFAGAYWGYGFHEDGVRSALEVCERFGVGL